MKWIQVHRLHTHPIQLLLCCGRQNSHARGANKFALALEEGSTCHGDATHLPLIIYYMIHIGSRFQVINYNILVQGSRSQVRGPKSEVRRTHLLADPTFCVSTMIPNHHNEQHHARTLFLSQNQHFACPTVVLIHWSVLFFYPTIVETEQSSTNNDGEAMR
jgi:hypothetical protein